jgi:tetratricopeptide (TPR) repeat protein
MSADERIQLVWGGDFVVDRTGGEALFRRSRRHGLDHVRGPIMRGRPYVVLAILGLALGIAACAPSGGTVGVDRGAAEEALRRGWAAHEAGDWRAAEYEYLESVKYDPSYVWTYYRLGVLAANHNRWGSAEAYFWRAITVDPSFMPPYYEVGVRRALAGDLDGAVELLRRAVQLAPADPYSRLQLGRAYQALGQQTEAMQQFAAARDLAPDADEILASLPAWQLR